MFCKSCGNRLGPNDTVCAHCGAAVPGAAQPRKPEPEPEITIRKKPVQPDALFAQKQSAAAAPKAEETPAVEKVPATELSAPEETPVPEEIPAEIPAPEETPVAEEIPAVEETPAAEETPVEEEMPAAEETPEAEDTPAPEETAEAEEIPTAEEEPAPEETPAEEAAAAEEVPADEEAPAPENKFAIEKTPEPDTAPQPTPRVTTTPRESRSARSSAAWVKAICVICALAIIALTCVNAFTDVFHTDNDAVKTVALSALPETEKEGCLQFLSQFSPFYGKTINFEEMGHYAFLDLLEPGNANGLYASFYPTPTPITDTADPAGRFALEGGGWRYYKIPFKELSEIASQFDLDLIGCANRADCYFANGYYYFSARDTETGTKRATSLSLVSSKRTEDGSYYIVAETQDAVKVYAMVTLTKEGETAVWDLLRLSADPLFTDDGMPTAEVSGKTLDYEMRQRVITAKADDKTEYATYVIDYPYFTDVTDKTAITINTLYGEIIKSYKDKAAEAEESYQRYLKRGYDTSLLPAYTYVISTVTYDKNGHISLLDEVTTYTPEKIAKARKKAQTTALENGTTPELPEVPLFPSVTYSGYTVDTATGEILKKETVFGTDYSRYQDELARVFSDTHYVERAQFETVGQAIYESTWFLAEDGICFCYLGGEDYVQFVTLPYSAVNYTF